MLRNTSEPGERATSRPSERTLRPSERTLPLARGSALFGVPDRRHESEALQNFNLIPSLQNLQSQCLIMRLFRFKRSFNHLFRLLPIFSRNLDHINSKIFLKSIQLLPTLLIMNKRNTNPRPSKPSCPSDTMEICLKIRIPSLIHW